MLTWPFSSNWLLVNFNLSNEIICFIHVLPGAGESGCKCMRGGDTGSALPATTQLELWNEYRYRLSSTGTKSIIMMYIAVGSRPQTRTWNVGNMRRPVLVTIISVPCSWNLSHNCLVSRMAVACPSAGWYTIGSFGWVHFFVPFDRCLFESCSELMSVSLSYSPTELLLSIGDVMFKSIWSNGLYEARSLPAVCMHAEIDVQCNTL